MRIWCLHGSLQTALVWKPIGNAIESEFGSVQVEAVNLYENEYESFGDWREQFYEKVEEQTKGEPSLLLGYSMGGRLAMNALVNNPAMWSGVIAVGADPGLISDDARSKQLQKDLEWARRFRTEDIQELLVEWDELPVFCGRSNCASREISELDSEKISRFFDVFSKARQGNMLPMLRKLKTPPLLYISGCDDIKYTKIGQDLAAHCMQVRHQIIPNAGHRVPWESQDAFISEVSVFIDAVLNK
ncbi:alpha/beta fold hydrolase [Opitutales bacterium]|nr:alpha/beta fold hydrolase [Opitutales bacterium]